MYAFCHKETSACNRSNSIWTSWDSISKGLNIADLKRIKFLNMSSGEVGKQKLGILIFVVKHTYLWL